MYYRASFSFGTTGNKSLYVDLGGAIPKGYRITMGARLNTTETQPIFSQGGSDGTRTHCFSTAPGLSKRWPYTGESNYVIAHHSTAGAKVLSGTHVGLSSDQIDINLDAANSNYPAIVEAWD